MPKGDFTSTIFFTIAMIVVFYLLMFLPQKKKQKKAKEMMDSLKEGERIVTIGGVLGKIINIKDEEVTIETSVERTQIVVYKWAVREVVKEFDK